MEDYSEIDDSNVTFPKKKNMNPNEASEIILESKNEIHPNIGEELNLNLNESEKISKALNNSNKEIKISGFKEGKFCQLDKIDEEEDLEIEQVPPYFSINKSSLAKSNINIPNSEDVKDNSLSKAFILGNHPNYNKNSERSINQENNNSNSIKVSEENNDYSKEKEDIHSLFDDRENENGVSGSEERDNDINSENTLIQKVDKKAKKDPTFQKLKIKREKLEIQNKFDVLQNAVNKDIENETNKEEQNTDNLNLEEEEEDVQPFTKKIKYFPLQFLKSHESDEEDNEDGNEEENEEENIGPDPVEETLKIQNEEIKKENVPERSNMINQLPLEEEKKIIKLNQEDGNVKCESLQERNQKLQALNNLNSPNEKNFREKMNPF